MTLRKAVDCAMPALLLPLMAYALIGEAFHEVAGMAMLGLFLLHLWQNRAWLKSIAKGRQSPARILRTLCSLTLLAAAISQAGSGIAMSGHLFPFLPTSGMAADARAVHLACGSWLFVLMAFHAGLHGRKLLPQLGRKLTGPALPAVCACLAAVALYGAEAFAARGMPGHMFLQTAFAFFDHDEQLLYLFADHAAIFLLFALAGHVTQQSVEWSSLRKCRSSGDGQSGRKLP